MHNPKFSVLSWRFVILKWKIKVTWQRRLLLLLFFCVLSLKILRSYVVLFSSGLLSDVSYLLMQEIFHSSLHVYWRSENVEGHPNLGLLCNFSSNPTYPPPTDHQVNPSPLTLKSMESFQVSSMQACCGILLTDWVQMGFQLLRWYDKPLAKSLP